MNTDRQKIDDTGLLPYGQLATRQWLLQKGLSRHALDNAVKSGKLRALARGVVARPGVPLTWQGLAASLNRIYTEPVYVGGLTALVQAGLGHNLSMKKRIHFYSAAPCPAWLEKLPLDEEISWHGTRRLWQQDGLEKANSLKKEPTGEAYFLLAAVEQAWLEVLADVPGNTSFEHADQLMQGLTALSPNRLDALLRVCRNVKVKRLFFFFGNRYQYSWFNKLDRNDYDLGRGKRVVEKGGKLDSEFLITVPEELHGR